MKEKNTISPFFIPYLFTRVVIQYIIKDIFGDVYFLGCPSLVWPGQPQTSRFNRCRSSNVLKLDRLRCCRNDYENSFNNNVMFISMILGPLHFHGLLEFRVTLNSIDNLLFNWRSFEMETSLRRQNHFYRSLFIFSVTNKIIFRETRENDEKKVTLCKN